MFTGLSAGGIVVAPFAAWAVAEHGLGRGTEILAATYVPGILPLALWRLLPRPRGETDLAGEFDGGEDPGVLAFDDAAQAGLTEAWKALRVEIGPVQNAKAFFGTSGSDANDTQVKLVWYYNNALGRPEKKKIISRRRGYHGVSLAAGSMTGLPPFHKSFDLPLPQFRHVTCPHYYRDGKPGETKAEFTARLAAELDKLIRAEGPETVAAFIAEPVLGAGGVVVPPEGYYPAIQKVLDEHDVLLIDDEIICGFGRLGTPFGAEAMGMRPDTASVAKALSSAYLPISAVLVPDEMVDVFVEAGERWGVFGHGFTYTGHPVCAAVALKALELMEERNLFAHAARVGRYFQTGLRRFADHPLVGEVRGKGLLGACELVADKRTREAFPVRRGVGTYCMERCLDQALILRALGDTVAFCPPLIVTESDIDQILERFGRGLDETLAWVEAGGGAS